MGLRRQIGRGTVCPSICEGLFGSKVGEFARCDFALAAFKIIEADGVVEIGQFRVMPILKTGKQVEKTFHKKAPSIGVALNMLRRSMND